MELSDAVKKLLSHIECPVCLETLTSPKLLSCGHRFCEKCLEKQCYYDQFGMLFINCPLCRSRTNNSVAGLPNDRLAANIGDDIQHIECLLEAAQNCAVCVDVPAQVRCLSCRVSLCGDCHIEHSSAHQDKNHTVVKDDPSLLCTAHGKELGFVCEHCHELACLCCLLDECVGHKHCTVGDALERYFDVKAKTERDTEFIKENYTILKHRLTSTFQTVSTSIQNYCDDAVAAIEDETEKLKKYLDKIESDALAILEATKTATDGLMYFDDARLEDCRFELPIELLTHLPHILRPEVQQSHDSYVLEGITFEPNTNLSVGSVRVSLCKSESNTFDASFPNLYGSQFIGAQLYKSREIIGDLRKLSVTLNPGRKGSTITNLFPDDPLLALRYLFFTEDWYHTC